MDVLTHCHRLRLFLPVAILMLLGITQLAAQDNSMTFTTQKSAATKDWTADTCIATRSGKTLIIRGLIATGRTDFPFQELHMVVTNYTGPGTYALNSSTYFEDLFGSKLVKTTFQSGTITTETDQATGGFKGTFSMLLYSNPPNLDQFTTRIYNGAFSVAPTTLMLEAKTKRDTILARAGDKGRLIKIIATDEFGSIIKDADITTLNPVAGGAKALGKTDDKGELLYSFDVDKATATGDYIIKFNGKKAKLQDAEEVHKVISVSGRYWVYKCGGVELLTFDAGEGNEWKKREAPSTVMDATGATITIDQILKFNGKMSIDSATNTIVYDGQLYVANIPLPGGSTGNFEINTKPQGQLTLNCNTQLKYLIPEICKVKLGGLTLSLEELEIVDLQVESGLKLKVKAEIKGLSTDCSKSNDKTKASIAGGMTISSSGIQEWIIEVTNGLFYSPYFCMNDLKVGYNAQLDKWTASVAMQAQGVTDPKKVTTLKGGMAIIKGMLDSAGCEFKSGECVPIPDVPFCIFGGKLGFSGLSTGFTTTAGSINAGLFFKTDEAIVLQKFPWLSKVFNDPGIAEIGVEGKWTFPRKFTGTTTWKLLKFPKISVTKPWQIEASGSAEVNLDNDLRLVPSNIKAFHFGADDYFIVASSGSAHFTWGSDLMFEYDLGGATLRIPDVPSDAVEHTGRAFLKWLKGSGYIPVSLGTGRAYISLSQLYGMKMEAYADLSSNPVEALKRLGRVSIKLECSDKTNANLHFTLEAGGTSLVQIGGVAGRKTEGNGIQSAGRELPGPFVAHALDTFIVKPNLERMNIFIEGQGSAPPVAYLIAPNGTRYDASSPDGKIIIDQQTPGDVRMLTVINPAAGAWVLGLVNPKPTDSVTVILPPAPERSFAINAAESNRKLTVTWNTAGLTADDAVAVHLDNINDDGGRMIGMARGTDGKFEYTFTDSLPECSYKVHAVLSGDGNPPITARASGEFSTGKSILPPPQNVAILTNTIGQATVTWSASPDPAVQTYLVYVRGVETYDSLLVAVPAYTTMARVAADTALLRTLSIRSADLDGKLGCPSSPASVGLLGVDEHRAVAGASMSQISVVPNPVAGSANIHWVSDQPAMTVVEVRNMLGETVARFDLGRSEQGSHDVQWSTEAVADGTYLVVVQTGSAVRTAKVTVIR